MIEKLVSVAFYVLKPVPAEQSLQPKRGKWSLTLIDVYFVVNVWRHAQKMLLASLRILK